MSMMAYRLSVDVTMAVDVVIVAQDENQAREFFKKKMENNPYETALEADRFVSYEIVDVTEEEPEQPEPDRRRF